MSLQTTERHGAGADHPRHGRRRRDRRPRHRAIRGTAGRGERDARTCSPTRIIPIPRRCSPPCPSARRERRLPAIPGVVPGQFDRPRRLPVRAALRLRLRPVPPRRAAAAPRRNSAARAATRRCDDGAPRRSRARGGRMSAGPRSARRSRANIVVSRGLFRPQATVKALAGVSLLAGGRAGRSRSSANPAPANRRSRGC